MTDFTKTFKSLDTLGTTHPLYTALVTDMAADFAEQFPHLDDWGRVSVAEAFRQAWHAFAEHLEDAQDIYSECYHSHRVQQAAGFSRLEEQVTGGADWSCEQAFRVYGDDYAGIYLIEDDGSWCLCSRVYDAVEGIAVVDAMGDYTDDWARALSWAMAY